MKMIPLKTCLCISILVMQFACTSPRKTSSENLPEPSLPELPLSELDIPIKIAAAPILANAEQAIPAEFTSDGWPEFIRPSCDFKYKYRFVRSGLQLSCINNQLTIRFGGNYQVNGGKSLCTAGIPVTPWIYGACGFAPQPMRKVLMTLQSNLQFLPAYQLRTVTSVISVQPVDKCTVSAFSNDITQMIMDSIRSSLLTFAGAMDQTVAGLHFTGLINPVKDSCYRKISVGSYGYFLLNPSAVRIGPLNYAKDSFAISLGISCKPLLTSDPVNHIPVPPSLPPLLQTESRNGIRLYLNMKYDFNFLTKILQDSLYNKVFDVSGRTIVVKEARIQGIGNHAIEIKIDFAGSNHGSIFLRGIPTLDTAKQTLALTDIQYSMAGEDLALKIGKSLFRNKIRKTIQGKSYLDIPAWINANKAMINQMLNRELAKNVYSSGNIRDAKIIGMLVTAQDIQIQVFITGELKISAGNL